MKISKLKILALLALGTSSMSNAQTILEHSKVIEPQPLSYADFPKSESFTDGMKVMKADFSQRDVSAFVNIEYAHKSGMALHLNVLTPSPFTEGAPQTKYPLIVYVQGSAWMKQEMYALPQLARLAQKGYAIAIVEYRHSAVAGFPAQIEDTKSAIRYMLHNADKYQADASNVILWGDSSGGHTALMTAVTLDENKFDDEGQDKQPITLKAVIDFYGPTDISKMNKELSTWDHMSAKSPEGMFLGGVNVLDNPDKVAPTVPMNYVTSDKKLPPFLLVHGNKDRLVPFGQSVMMFDALKNGKQDATMIMLDGADHGGEPFWSKEMLKTVDEFIKDKINQ
ncbi:alpha/beta hydrolase [Vibrio parahaemolyticus]|uniref:alpha/beta hydrolase n=1 Tax=Vibrio parahaemolyticus TaxID=670 RepID=UPI001121743B|nr:alpha/beta hydrolase [Vibrio parahaemolyticus]TOP86018.1 esterase [Vibrio parahaemolyticus]